MLHLPPLNGVSSCRLLRVVLMYLSRTCETVSSCSPLSVDNKAYKHKLPTEGRVVYIATMALPIQQHQRSSGHDDLHLAFLKSSYVSGLLLGQGTYCTDLPHCHACFTKLLSCPVLPCQSPGLGASWISCQGMCFPVRHAHGNPAALQDASEREGRISF